MVEDGEDECEGCLKSLRGMQYLNHSDGHREASDKMLKRAMMTVDARPKTVVNVCRLSRRSRQANKQSDEAVKEKAFSALVVAVKTIQSERATILNALVRMRMRYVGGLTFACWCWCRW